MSSTRREFLGTTAAVAPTVVAATGLTLGELLPTPPVDVPTTTALPPLKLATPPAQSALGVISASVHSGLLTKVDRLFRGDVQTRVVELVQNARRAGAKTLSVTVTKLPDQEDLPARWEITLEDDGHGIVDFGQLLKLGFSGWSDETEAAEDPAGAGFFCLAPRDVLVCSRGRQVQLTKSGWLGMPVRVEPSDYQGTGVLLRFVDTTEWSERQVRDCTQYGNLRLKFNDQFHEPQEFLLRDEGEAEIRHLPELGVKLQIVTRGSAQGRWQQWYPTSIYPSHRVCLNFYGQAVTSTLECSALSELDLLALVDMTGEPTPLRLQLPDRRNMVQNEALAQLQQEIKLATYRLLLDGRAHNLSYAAYREAHAAGIAIPEAQPTFLSGVGDWPYDYADDCGSDFKHAVRNLSGPRIEISGDLHDDAEGRTVDLLAEFSETFDYRPSAVDSKYHGYSWAKFSRRAALLELETVPLDRPVGRNGNGHFYLHDGSLTVVKSLAAQIGWERDGDEEPTVDEVHAVPLAAESYDNAVITEDALLSGDFDQRLFYLTGTLCEDNDAEMQFDSFYEELEAVKCALLHKHEYARRKLMQAVEKFVSATADSSASKDFKSVVIGPGGTVSVRAKNGKKWMLKNFAKNSDPTV